MDSSTVQPLTASSALDHARELEDQYLLPTYARIPMLLEKGKGVFVYDSEGNRYLDFISGIGVNALGHAHPRLVKVIREQSSQLIHISNLYYHEWQGKLAERLVRLSGMERAFFTNSGTEAVEGALKLARRMGQQRSPEKFEIVALENSFHGRSFGALSVTGQEKYRTPFGPALPGVRFVPAGDAEALARAVGPNTCAIILEPIQGEGGIHEMDADYLATAARLAEEHHAALIFDEIQCGVGRTGKFFAYQWNLVVPDIVITAKPIANGMPLGVILARGEAAKAFSPGLHGTTYGGGPLSCRVALEVLDIFEQDRVLENVQQVGGEMKSALNQLRGHFSCIRSVRGRGLMLGIELDRDARPAVEQLRQLGLLANATHETVIRMLPPYIITSQHADRAVRILTRVLKSLK